MSMYLRSICTLFALFVLTIGNSQEVMYMAFLQDSIGVGENADLYISIDENAVGSVQEISLDFTESIQFYSATTPPGDSIKPQKADLIVNNWGQWQDANKDGTLQGEEINWEKVENNGETVYRNRLNISFFDVGIYVVEGFQFLVNNNPGQTNRALLKVNFKEYDLEVVDSTGLAPIKDIEREGLSITDFIPYLLYVLIPIILTFLIYRYYKKKNNIEAVVREEEVVYIPPDVKALTELKELRSKELWQKGEIKLYQSELSHIIREYLEGRYDIKALENTTSQIIRSIRDKSFTAEDQDKLTRILQMADLVKFAKAKPEINIHEEFMNDAVEFVQRTRKVDMVTDEEEEE